MKMAFVGGVALLITACWGIICLSRRGDTVHENPIWWGGGYSAVGTIAVFLMALFGVALICRGIDFRWRDSRHRPRSKHSGFNNRTAPNGGSAAPPDNSDAKEGRSW